MSSALVLFAWNLLTVIALSVVVWWASRRRWLRQRPALCHVLWLLVLVKMVTPPLVALPVLPASVAQSLGESPSLVRQADGTGDGRRDAGAGDEVLGASPRETPDVAVRKMAADAVDAPDGADAVAAADAPDARPAVASGAEIWLPGWPTVFAALLGGSLLVSAFMVLSAVRQCVRVRRLLQGNVCPPGRATDSLRTLSRVFGSRAEPKLVIIDESLAPMLWTAPGSTTIVLPRQVVDALDDDQLESVIAHELAHFVRRDHWTNVFAFVVTSLFWWNPCAWFARREMRDAAEACCDALVLGRLRHSRRSYARTLLTIVDFVTLNRPLSPALAVSFGEGRSLRRRIAMVANRNVTAGISPLGWSLVAAATLLLLLAPTRAEEPGQTAPKTPDAAAKDARAKEDKQETQGQIVNPESRKKVAHDEIAGVVVDSAGKPLEGVLVDVWTWHKGNETKTDKEGAFRVKTREERERVEIRFSKDGYSPFYNFQQPPGVNDLLVTLGNKTYLEGTLRGPDGKPVADATIRGEQGEKRADGVVIGGVTTTTTTDASGRYRLYVFPDTYEIKVAVPGVGVSRTPGIAVAQDEARSLDIELTPGVRFQANVVEAGTNKPVSGLVLWSWRDRSVKGVSDENGKIVIDGMLPGEFEFNVGNGEPRKLASADFYEHGEFGRWWSADGMREWDRKQNADHGWQRNFDDLTFSLSLDMKPVTIEVERGVVFSGHVYDPDGKPVAGATVAPAKTGSGNSLTGDTRYSVQTKKDGSYRVVMPAGNDFQYNLIAHDGKYSQWRKWANCVSEPLETKPGQQFDNFDFTLNRGATVRGRIVTDADLVIGKREVRAHAADLRENRYYDPTTRVRDDGTFELKFIRPGKHFIQVDPFWLSAAEGPEGSSAVVELAAGEVREGIELRVSPSAQPVAPALATRTFRVKVLDAAGQPMANQSVAISTTAKPLDFGFLVGDRPGLLKRSEGVLLGNSLLATGEQGVLDVAGSALFGSQPGAATVLAIDPVKSLGSIGEVRPDLKTPEITLVMLPLCETTLAISRADLPDPNQPVQLYLMSGQSLVLSSQLKGDSAVLQLPTGKFRLIAGGQSAQNKTVDFTIRPDQTHVELDPIRLEPTHLAKLIGKPAPELRGIAAWHNGEPVKLSDLHGKVVILDFWGYWCGPCVAAMPNLMKLHDSYSQDEVVIIAVHDGSVKTMDELLKNTEHSKQHLWEGRELPFRIALAGGGESKIPGTEISANAQAIADYGINAFPTTLLIDQQGTLVEQLNPHDVDATTKRVDRLLGK